MKRPIEFLVDYKSETRNEKVDHRKRNSKVDRESREIHKGLDEIFLISDLHLDHINIIRYSNRPFSSIDEMNKSIVRNWNRTVRKRDVVFFLGDMAFGRRSKTIEYWAYKLKGNIIFIKGSHDRSKTIEFYDKLVLRVDDHRFLLVHDPIRKPRNWNGWVIHGHLHNREPNYSLVNKENRTINVSAEMIDYTPISLEKLLEFAR